jgi:SAM-dependent methyltransferase
MTTVLVDPSNAGQASAWDGPEGEFWAEEADAFDRSVAAYDADLLAAADLRPGERVLDVGCGTGHITREAARRCAPGTAVGIDLSARMIEVARSRGGGGVSYRQADAQVAALDEVDVVLSRTGAMFFGRPADAFANLRRALKPDGRIVLLVWQAYERNEWIRDLRAALAAGRDLPMPPADAPGPFSLADPGRLRSLLTGAGFADLHVADVRRPMDFGPDVDSAYALLTGLLGWMLHGLDDAARTGALAELRRTLQEHATPDGVRFGSAAWLVTGRAV